MICGGNRTKRIEYLNPSESGYTSTIASVSLPSNAKFNGLLYKERILTFYKGVVETTLESPGESKTLLQEKENRNSFAGLHCFGDNIYIVGGREGSMEKYDVAKKELEILPLPYKVSGMATVAYKDNIIILGGQCENKLLNDVQIFNVTTHEYKRLPSMTKKRRLFAAVIMGDVIVVMGGLGGKAGGLDIYQNTVEYYVIGDSAWHELPAMNLARSGATACVYV